MVQVSVNPESYFRNHAQGNQAPRSGEEMHVDPTPIVTQWVEYARTDFEQPARTKTDIASLAVEFGAARPIVEWGMPVERFPDISRAMQVERMENGVAVLPGPMDTSGEPKATGPTMRVRVDNNTWELLDRYQMVLECSQSVAIRHCMALAFRWYSPSVVDGTMAEAWNRQTQQYVRRFRDELSARVDFARDQLGVDI